MDKRIILYVLAILTLSTQAAAIGISPIEKYTTCNATKITLRLVNNERKNTTAVLSVSGELGEYAKIKDKEIKLNEKEFTKKFYIYLNLPKDLNPGTHEIKITAIEKSKKTGQIKAIAANTAKIKILVPYKDSLVKGKMLFDKKTESISIGLFNFGKKDANATLKLYFKGNKKRLYKTISFEIKSQKEKDFLFLLKNLNLKYGEYKAIAEISYGSKKTTLNKSIIYGLPNIKIKGIYFEKFSYKGINKIIIKLNSEWNKKFSIAAKIKIADTESEQQAKKIKPEKDETMQLIIDLTNINANNYTAEIFLTYYNYTDARKESLVIEKESAYFQRYKKTKKLSPYIAAVTMLIILVVLTDILFLIRKKLKKR